jgi:6-phosphogluconolactonase
MKMLRLVLIIIFLITLSFTEAQQRNSKYFVYVSLKNSNAIVTYTLDPLNGNLTLTDSLTIPGGPAPMGTDPGNEYLYVGQRTSNTLSAYRINHTNGKLTYINTVPAVDNPVYVVTDLRKNFLLSAYYAVGKAGIYSLNSDGSIKNDPVQILEGFVNAHSIMIDPSNKFALIADKGGDKIYQYLFDEKSGKLTPNLPASISTPKRTEPRHFIFYSEKNIVYFVNETNNTVTVYHFNSNKGILKELQNLTTLPPDFKGQSKCADIHQTPDKKFLYASNRGYNSIAAFSIDKDNGLLKPAGIYESVKSPRSFAIDPSGNYLVAVGESSNELISYRINKGTGALQTLKKFYIGEVPSWVMILDL